MASADELKAQGNAAIAAKNFDEAITKFTEAIELQPENHILYSNRSAAYASKRQWNEALDDASKTTELKPDWGKGWGRKGAALHGQGDYEGATAAYNEGLKLDPNNATLKSGLESVAKAAAEADARGGGGDGSGNPLGSLFSDPGFFAKLASNPKTASLLGDQEFMAKIRTMQQNPNAMSPDFLQDPRMLQALGVAMGVDISTAEGPEGSADAAAARFREGGNDDTFSAASGARPSSASPSSPPPPRQQQQQQPQQQASSSPPKQSKQEPEPEPELDDEDALAKKKAKEEADHEKALGTTEYKKRNFDAAIEHYTKAWDLFQDITYLNNLGAAQFEKGDYQACVDACTRAIEHGREVFADFKMVAKSYARLGAAYERLGDYDAAIEQYKKSLTEHRTPDVLNKLRAAEKNKVEHARTAYIDPVLAEAAREEGNKKFKEMDWPGAVAAYTEMTKRAPDDPRGYSNRAAAFVKLLEFPSAIDDCDQAIKRDRTFVRAYIRKAQAYFGMRKYSDCVDACTEAQTVDLESHGGANAHEIEQQQQKALQAMYSARENETEEQTRERLMQDPDIMAIMQDPIMNAILQQAQTDPAALQEHMKNPSVRSKIQKLVAAGVVRVGR